MGGDDVAENISSPHNHHRRSHTHFPVGSSVEVRTEDEGFKRVFFSATVIPPPPSTRQTSNRLYVEYHNLLVREGRSDRLREHVDVAFVRPTPPLEETVKGFEPDDVVDAYYNDGWWNGVVSRVVEGGERFVVMFEDPPDELEFGVDELRAHWDWVDGKWVRPQSKAGLMFEVGREVEVSFDREDFQDAWFPATIQQDLENGVFSVEYGSEKDKNTKAQVDSSSLHLRPRPPLLKDKKNFILLEKVDAFFEFGWWSGVITKELEDSRYVVFFEQMNLDKEFNHSELRLHMELKDGKWLLSSDDGVNEDHYTPDNDLNTPCVTKRRRYLSDSGTTLETSYNCSREMECLRIPKSIRSKRVTRNIKRTLLRVDQEKGLQESVKVGENHSLDREERHSTSEKIVVQDSVEGKTMEIDHAVEVEEVVGEVPRNEFDDDPLSKWIEEMDNSPSLIDGSRVSPVGNVERCMVDGEKQRGDVVLDDVDSGKQASSALVDKGSILPSEPQSLPFVKNFSLWKTIESMEVFKRIPQKPHFHPLGHFNESLREGLAIGYMATFAGLVEKTCRLQLNVEKSIIDDIMDTLSVLEEHGFDVSVVRDSITKLVVLKEKEEKLVDEVNNINNKILESNHENTWIEKEIREINEQIWKFQEQLLCAESAKAKGDEEIASLRARLKETEESIKNARCDFEGTISSIL